MSNRELYKKTFANVTTSTTLNLEDVMENSTGRPLRVKRSLLVVSLVLILLMAMSAITYAVTDGKIVDYVGVLINGEPVKDEPYIVEGENGQIFKIEIDADSVDEGEDEIRIDIREE